MSEVTNSNNTARPTILLVEEDDEARPLLTNHLRQLGYRLLVAADWEDAIVWMSAEKVIPADLVLIDLVGKSTEESLNFGRRLRQQAKYNGVTPLIVMPEKMPAELAGRDDNVVGNDWVCYWEDGSNQLEALLARLLNGQPK